MTLSTGVACGAMLLEQGAMALWFSVQERNQDRLLTVGRSKSADQG